MHVAAPLVFLGFLRDDFQIEWLGNSLAPQLCVNYQPPLCADGRNREFLDWMSVP